MAESAFLADIRILCERARQASAIAEKPLDRKTALKLLNEALATELVCMLRYKRHYFMASAMNAKLAHEFLQHVNEEQAHADQIAARIVQLGGEPDFSPEGIVRRSHSEYVAGETLIDMIREDLVAELVAIESYREIISHFGNDDQTSRRMLEEILRAEEAHLGDMAALLEKFARQP